MDGNKKLDEGLLMECDMDGTFQIVANCKSLENTKNHRRKKIRRLVDSAGLEKKKNASANKCKRVLLIISLLLITTVAMLIGQYFSQNNSNTKQLLKEFIQNYRNQYREIVHGKSNYCDQKQHLDTATIFTRIKESHILHQEQALHKIQLALRNESNLNTIALVGPVGVGKTLFLKALQQNFPWQENVHTYAWNTYVHDEVKKFHLVRLIIENLSECGQNLLVIENMKACDHGVVAIINQLLVESNKRQRKRVILFYVFSLNTMLTSETYAVQKYLLQSLPDCNIINFKPFTQHELRDCIQREVEKENVALTKESYDDIVETIDPLKSGCKNVNAKVVMYGTINT